MFILKNGKNVRNFVRSLASESRRKWEKMYGPLKESRLPSVEDVRYIASLLRGDFDKAVPLKTVIGITDEALIALTEEQYRCLDQIDDNSRCLIQGSAGTGKTLLAIEEAKKSVAKGEHIALFCFNQNLAEWLKLYFDQEPENLRPKYIGTLHKFMLNLVKENNLDFSIPDNEYELEYFFNNELPNALTDVLDNQEPLFDKIIIDEAQDLIKFNFLSVYDSILKKGITRGAWTMLGDFNMQAIYSEDIDGAEMIEMLEELTSFIRFKLTRNCRNTRQICEEIHTVTGLETLNIMSLIDGMPVQYYKYKTEKELKEKLEVLLNTLKNSQVSPESITLLSPYRRERSVLRLLEKYRIDNYSPQNTGAITFSTIQGFKGLENSITILTDIDTLKDTKLAYVGLSRARSGLYVFISDEASLEYLDLQKRRFKV